MGGFDLISSSVGLDLNKIGVGKEKFFPVLEVGNRPVSKKKTFASLRVKSFLT